MKNINAVLFAIMITFLTACSDGAGKLKGTWKLSGIVPVTVTFRDDEEESLGMISKVTYEHRGDDVLVTYTSGMAEGTTMRVTLKNNNTAFVSSLGKLTRIK